MFDSWYEFKYVQSIISSDGIPLKTHRYSFKTSKKLRFLVDVEEYDFQVFIVKFYLKSHLYSDKRFNLLTNDFDTPRKLGTCLQIMLSIYKKNPLASFGFIGAPIIDDKRNINEEENNTKRYRIYSTMVKSLFSDVHFTHSYNQRKSAYTLINKDNLEPELFTKVQKMFVDYYPSLR